MDQSPKSGEVTTNSVATDPACVGANATSIRVSPPGAGQGPTSPSTLKGPCRSATFICSAATGVVPVFLTITAAVATCPTGTAPKSSPSAGKSTRVGTTATAWSGTTKRRSLNKAATCNVSSPAYSPAAVALKRTSTLPTPLPSKRSVSDNALKPSPLIPTITSSASPCRFSTEINARVSTPTPTMPKSSAFGSMARGWASRTAGRSRRASRRKKEERPTRQNTEYNVCRSSTSQRSGKLPLGYSLRRFRSLSVSRNIR